MMLWQGTKTDMIVPEHHRICPYVLCAAVHWPAWAGATSASPATSGYENTPGAQITLRHSCTKV
jgi:hypothetical protein